MTKQKKPPLVLVVSKLSTEVSTMTTTYHGRACVKCKGTERYTRNNACATCGRKMNKKNNRNYSAKETAKNQKASEIAQQELAELKKSNSKQKTHSAIDVIEIAKEILERAGKGYYHNNHYYIEHRIVGILEFLRAANQLISEGKAETQLGKVTQLLGSKHERWGV